jgi:hypothetical protein
MAAPKGNKFWEHRKKHGRDYEFKTAKELEEAAEIYFQTADKTVIEEEVPHVKLGTVKLKKKVPYLKEDLAEEIGVSAWRVIEAYKDRGEDFLQVVSRIENRITGNKKRGAYVGVFNSNIVARDLGLKDSQEVNANVSVKDVSDTRFTLKTPPPNTDIA